MNSRHLLLALMSAPAMLLASGAAIAQDANSPWQRDLYFRLEGGGAWLAEDRGNWTGPGPSDPQITHSLNDPAAFLGTVAVGSTFYNGVRGDVSLSYLSEMNVDANWIAPQAGSPHADIQADVSTWLVMGNLFVEPLALAGYDSPIKPFVTGGIGVAFNQMDDWTRTNSTSVRPVRTFEGHTETDFAWSVGGGLSAELGDLFGTGSPVKLDLTYRYTDAGEAKGGSTPLPGNGTSEPREAFNYDNRFHAVSLGIRIPFSTY